jgi:hypothetical protein
MSAYPNQILVNGKPLSEIRLSDSDLDSFSSQSVVFIVIPVDGGYLVICVKFYRDGRIIVTVKFIPSRKTLKQSTLKDRFYQRTEIVDKFEEQNKVIKFRQSYVDEESVERTVEICVLPGEEDEPRTETKEQDEILQKFKILKL